MSLLCFAWRHRHYVLPGLAFWWLCSLGYAMEHNDRYARMTVAATVGFSVAFLISLARVSRRLPRVSRRLR